MFGAKSPARTCVTALAIAVGASGCIQPRSVPPVDASSGVCRIQAVNPEGWPDLKASHGWAQVEGGGPNNSAYLDGDQIRRNGFFIGHTDHIPIARKRGSSVEVQLRTTYSSPADVRTHRVRVTFNLLDFDFDVTGDCTTDDRIVGVALAMTLLLQQLDSIGAI